MNHKMILQSKCVMRCYFSWTPQMKTLNLSNVHIHPYRTEEMKINTWLSKNIHFLWPCICREQDCNTIFSAHIHRTLTVLSFRAGHISSTLCNIIFGTLVARDCRFFCSLEICSSHMTDCWLCKKANYNDPCNITSHFWYLLGYLLILKVNIEITSCV
jgi:hypothetical protein